MVGGALLRTPTSFYSYNRPGGVSHIAPFGLNFDVRPGGAICAARPVSSVSSA